MSRFLAYFIGLLKQQWLYMLELPWRDPRPGVAREVHWYYWFVGWAWALGGLVGGALVAPGLVQLAVRSDSSNYDWIIIGVAVLAGFLVQFCGWLIYAVTVALVAPFYERSGVTKVLGLLMFQVSVLLPLAGTGYGGFAQKPITAMESARRALPSAAGLPLSSGLATNLRAPCG